MAIVRESSSFNIFDEAENHLLTSKPISKKKRLSYMLGSGSWRQVSWSRAYITALHTALVGCIYIIAATNYESEISAIMKQRSWSPIQEFVEYEINDSHALNHKKYSEYSGPPTVQQDRAWDELMKPVYFKATREELQMAGESMENKVELEDGGYLGSLGVYHELHCLRQLRLYLYRDRYYENVTETQETYLRGHLDHCLETLRLTIMCHGNTGIYTFAWEDPMASKPETQSNSRAFCAEWSSIERWSLMRMTSRDPAILRAGM